MAKLQSASAVWLLVFCSQIVGQDGCYRLRGFFRAVFFFLAAGCAFFLAVFFLAVFFLAAGLRVTVTVFFLAVFFLAVFFLAGALGGRRGVSTSAGISNSMVTPSLDSSDSS